MIADITNKWLSLYKTAIEARDLAPWTWMFEDELFAVRLPDDPMTWYCSIMGVGGTHLCYCFYKDNAGLYGLQVMRKQAFEDINMEDASLMMTSQNCIQASFEDREHIPPNQKTKIKSLGLSFKGRNQWVSLTDYLPGLHPWLVETDQTETLETLLKQAMLVVSEKKANKRIIGPWNNGGEMPFFIAVKTAEGRYNWTEERHKVLVSKLKMVAKGASFPALWRKVAEMPTQKKDIICGLMSHQNPAQDEPNSRPFYIKILVMIDAVSGMILGTGMGNAVEQEKSLITFLQQSGFRPKNILVSNDEGLELFSEGCSLAGINIVKDIRVLGFMGEIEASFKSMGM